MLIFDFPAFKIGTVVFDDDNDPSIYTIFLFPKRVMASCDVRGGDPGVNKDQYSHYDAICIAGGSLRGLKVVSGVRAAMISEYRSERDLVSGAILNDGRNRTNKR
jgi:L-aminopeptidase/D-esterase-like protein